MQDSQPNLKLSNFLYPTKCGILNQNLAQLKNFLWLKKLTILKRNLAQFKNLYGQATGVESLQVQANY